MDDIKTYTGKNGSTVYTISIDELQWIKDNSELLDESTYKFLWTAVEDYGDGEEINPQNIFWFLHEHENFPELDGVIKIQRGEVRVDKQRMYEYLSKDDVDNIFAGRGSSKPAAQFFSDFLNGVYKEFKTKDGKSFDSPFDGLILIHRTGDIDIDSVITWFLLTQYDWRFDESVDYIVEYCETSADDPNWMK